MINFNIMMFKLFSDAVDRTAAAWDLFEMSVFLAVAVGVGLAGVCFTDLDAICEW